MTISYLPLVMNEFVVAEEEKMKPIVDISFWQTPALIDYDKFSNAIAGVILRGAYGIWKDTQFDKHYEEFRKRDVPIGSYHYIIGNYPGKSQAEIFNTITKDKTLKLGLWNDAEDRGVTTGLSRSVVNDYMTNIESMSGKKVGIYTGVYAWYEIMQNMSNTYGDRTLWVAHYGVTKPSLPRYSAWSKWNLWQWSSSGRIDGYSGNIDMNVFNGTEEEYRKFFNLDEIIIPTPPTQPETPTNGLTLPTLKVVKEVNVRPTPSTTIKEKRTRQIGETVKVEEIKVHAINNIWVRDQEGWSALVYYKTLYME